VAIDQGFIPVDPVRARRIAIRAQALDGSETDLYQLICRLGFVQMDPIATIARPQHLVPHSRLGAFDVAELDRLIWQRRKLFEWDAFIWPVMDLPLVRARMRRARARAHGWTREFMKANDRFRRARLRELERNGPLLSRDLKRAPPGLRRARPGPRRLPVPVRPADPRPPAGRGAVRLPLTARDVRAQGQAQVRLLRAANPAR
jgi:hypothetical protein